ncbi:MAG: hypothetical protein M1813_001624 [Trichoglossum hirsutum]|nr:MAG: hypothetical protein M1813_001624 [Trichoglossum hirsutum]
MLAASHANSGHYVGLLLKTAIEAAYLQHVWLRLRHNFVSLRAIDGAFDVLGGVFSLINWELLKKIDIAMVMGVILWRIPIATLFPPATLSTELGVRASEAKIRALTPSILDHVSGVISPYIEWQPDLSTHLPSAMLTFLSNSVAITGQPLPPYMLRPQANYSYSIQSYLPRLKCVGAGDVLNPTLVNATIQLLQKIQKDKQYIQLPISLNPQTLEFASDAPRAVPFGRVFYLGMALYVGPYETNNTTVIGAASINDGWRDSFNGTLLIVMKTAIGQTKVSSCTLYISSFQMDISFVNQVGSVQVTEVKDIAPYNFSFGQSHGDKYEDKANLTNTAVQLWFQSLSKHILGLRYMIHADAFPDGTIQNTVLSQSEDYSSMLDGYYRYFPGIVADQTKRNQTITQDKSLASMIEEFSTNFSLSLMSQRPLCRIISTNGTTSESHTIYRYHAKNLLISYSVAILCTLATVIVGFLAFHRNGTSYDNLASTIGASMQSPEALMGREMCAPLKSKPLCSTRVDDTAEKAKLRLERYTGTGDAEGEGGCLRFVIEDRAT